jgi:excisionase family DNA binding protein
VVAEVEVSAELSVQEAAYLAGVSERAVRNWLRDKKLPYTLSEQGKRISRSALLHFLQERRDQLAGPRTEATEPPSASAEPTPIRRPGTPEVAPEPSPAPPEPLTAPLVALVEKLHKENVELAGRVGFYQAKMQEYESRILLLEAPRQPAPVATPEPPPPVIPDQEPAAPPWWKRIFGIE